MIQRFLSNPKYSAVLGPLEQEEIIETHLKLEREKERVEKLYQDKQIIAQQRVEEAKASGDEWLWILDGDKIEECDRQYKRDREEVIEKMRQEASRLKRLIAQRTAEKIKSCASDGDCQDTDVEFDSDMESESCMQSMESISSTQMSQDCSQYLLLNVPYPAKPRKQTTQELLDMVE